MDPHPDFVFESRGQTDITMQNGTVRRGLRFTFTDGSMLGIIQKPCGNSEGLCIEDTMTLSPN